MSLQIIYMYKEGLTLNNHSGCYVLKPIQTKLYVFDIYV